MSKNANVESTGTGAASNTNLSLSPLRELVGTDPGGDEYTFDRLEFDFANFRCDPITSLTDPGSDDILNPSCCVTGRIAHFRAFFPGVPASNITWTAKYPDKVTILTPHAETVAVIPTATGENTLYANVRGYCGPRPCIEFTGVEETVTQVNAYILGANGVFATTEGAVRDKLEGVNRIYAQIGRKFILNIVTNVVVDDEYLQIPGESVEEFNEVSAHICDIAKDTGGLELYFVMNINVPRLAGYHFVHFNETTGFETLGIILTGSSSAKIIAHEIGHSCGFSDIYVSGSGAGGTPVLTAADPVRRSGMEHDWGCENHRSSSRNTRHRTR